MNLNCNKSVTKCIKQSNYNKNFLKLTKQKNYSIILEIYNGLIGNAHFSLRK